MEDDIREVLKAKPCFEHLGGTLGCRLFARLVELRWFEPEEGTRYFRVTDIGRTELEKLGVDVYSRQKKGGTAHDRL